MSIVDEVNNRDGVRVYANITNKKWESALGNSAATENENATGDMAGLCSVNGYPLPQLGSDRVVTDEIVQLFAELRFGWHEQ